MEMRFITVSQSNYKIVISLSSDYFIDSLVNFVSKHVHSAPETSNNLKELFKILICTEKFIDEHCNSFSIVNTESAILLQIGKFLLHQINGVCCSGKGLHASISIADEY